MGPGFKYHVVTIAAIFFALTVGLVVGSLFVSPQIADSQKRAINALRDTMNRDVIAQREQIRKYQDFLGQMTPALLKGRLNSIPIAIVQTGEYPELTEQVRETLKNAGAKVVAVMQTGRAFNRPDELLNQTLTSALPLTLLDAPTDRATLASTLVSAITKGNTPQTSIFQALEDADFAKISADTRYDKSPRYVIFITGSRLENTNRPQYVDIPLVTAFQKAGVRVIACEAQEVGSSDLKMYRALKTDIVTVENVDGDIGRCTLILALRGDRDETTNKTTTTAVPPEIGTEPN